MHRVSKNDCWGMAPQFLSCQKRRFFYVIPKETAGSLGGAKLGAMAGSAIGTAILPGVGTAIGGAAGGLILGIVGAFAGDKLAEYIVDITCSEE
jgi:uncharacterized protein YcfJ